MTDHPKTDLAIPSEEDAINNFERAIRLLKSSDANDGDFEKSLSIFKNFLDEIFSGTFEECQRCLDKTLEDKEKSIHATRALQRREAELSKSIVEKEAEFENLAKEVEELIQKTAQIRSKNDKIKKRAEAYKEISKTLAKVWEIC